MHSVEMLFKEEWIGITMKYIKKVKLEILSDLSYLKYHFIKT